MPKHPVAEAIQWVSRVSTVLGEMVLPGLAGYWLDRQVGTRYWAIVGFVVGFHLAVIHLLLIAYAAQQGDNDSQD